MTQIRQGLLLRYRDPYDHPGMHRSIVSEVAARMTWRLVLFSVLMGLAVLLVWNNYQETGSISKSMEKSWGDVISSDVVIQAKKAWQKSSKQSTLTMKKLKDGRLLQEAVKFVDKITMALFSVKTPELAAEVKKYDKALLDSVLFVMWSILGYICYRSVSTGFTLFSMATSLLVHALYGPAWCMTQLVIVLGLLAFFFSLVANNAVFTALVLSCCYALYAFWKFAGPNDSNRLDRIEARIGQVQEELNHIGQQISIVDNKVDLVRVPRS